MRIEQRKSAALILLGTACGCTGQLSESFRYAQQEQAFSTSQEVNTKIDLLWVVDNSASMDVNQEKLRAGFSSFATKYMKPTWDIRIAVITTDTYLANPAFSTYLNSVIPGTVGWKSSYINGITAGGVAGRTTAFINPTWNTSLVDSVTGKFLSGLKFNEMIPVWGPNWATLSPGYHDGPTTALCSEALPYFLKGNSQCAVRDDQTGNTGPQACVNPDATENESSVSQCVNTVQNDTVRSGKAIISTLPPTGVAGDSAWTNQLIQDFMVNASVGSAGSGSERGLASVLQLLEDNESGSTRFFRAGSLRGIIFLSDEEDQSLQITTPLPSGFSPWTGYKCDLDKLQELNPGNSTIATQLCCASGCTYKNEGTHCTTKTINKTSTSGDTSTTSYRISVCPSATLMAVADVKTSLDTFFKNLDGSSTEANYFVTSIVPMNGDSVESMQSDRVSEDTTVGAAKQWAVDRGDRYVELGTLVGNGSLAMNIADSDYSPILDAIGRALVEKKGTFLLDHAPTSSELMTVSIIHADGSSSVVSPSLYTIIGKKIVIQDIDFILSLSSTDRIVINYQPKDLN